MYLKADASSQHLSYKYFKGWRMLVTPGDRRLLNVSALNCVCLNYVANASQKLRNINMYHVRHMYSRIPTRPKMIYNVSMHFGHVPGRLSGRPLQASLNFFSCPAQEIKKTLFSIGFWRFWALNVLLSFLIGQEKVQENVQASLNFFAARWWCMNWLDALHTLWIHV